MPGRKHIYVYFLSMPGQARNPVSAKQHEALFMSTVSLFRVFREGLNQVIGDISVLFVFGFTLLTCN